MPSCFATAVAVGGINCISPRAPDGLTAPTSKLLSCRMMPKREGRIGRRGRVIGRGPAQHAAGQAHRAPCGGQRTPRRPACRHRAQRPRSRARSAEIGASSSIRVRNVRARCGSPQAISHAAARRTSCSVKASAVSCVQLGIAQLCDPGRRRLPKRQARRAGHRRSSARRRLSHIPPGYPAPPPQPSAPASNAPGLWRDDGVRFGQRPEMLLGRRRIVQHAQGDEAGQKFGLRTRFVRRLAMRRRQRHRRSWRRRHAAACAPADSAPTRTPPGCPSRRTRASSAARLGAWSVRRKARTRSSISPGQSATPAAAPPTSASVCGSSRFAASRASAAA